jgi:hypothetical protein
MTSLHHPEHSAEKPAVPPPAGPERPAEPLEALLRRAAAARELARAGFDGALLLSYVVWPAPFSRSAS